MSIANWQRFCSSPWPCAVGHRVVHGGYKLTHPELIDERIISLIEDASELAPLENPYNLTGIRVARRVLPDLPQVAVFNTAFHAAMPKHAFLYALPYRLYKKFHIRRYGFHGTSHKYAAMRAARHLKKDLDKLNLISCHLGDGASVAAIKQGRSIDTSMGFTPLEGLGMRTRCGDIDPAILAYLAKKGHDIGELKRICNEESGLLGISGVSNDMGELIRIAAEGHGEEQKRCQ
ncbi:acetate/propionate family kinase, partial [Candidatus Omnitrophota bacterium]